MENFTTAICLPSEARLHYSNKLMINMNIKQHISGFFKLFTTASKTENPNKDFPENVHKIPARFDSFVYLWNNSFNKNAVYTDHELSYSEYFGYGSSLGYIVKLTGKPDLVLDNKDYGIDILIYMLRIKGSEVRFELHFNEEKLFFINYTYFDISDIEKENVIAALTEKYQFNIPSSEIFDHIIIDREGNGLLIENNRDFSVNFLAPSSKIESIALSYAMGKLRAV